MIEIKLSDILKLAKKVEEAGANPKKLLVVIPENDPKVKFMVMEQPK